MLADVIKQRELERITYTKEEIEKYNHPYKRDTLIYFNDLYIMGGIQTWIMNLAEDYEFSVVYDKGAKERIEYLESLEIELIKYVGQELECDTLIRCMWGTTPIKANKTILAIHGDYSKLIYEKNDVPKHDIAVAVAKDSAIGWKKYYGEDAEVIYNPVCIREDTKPLVIGCFSRLSAEKGKKRYQYLIEKLKASGKPFLMLFFTDMPFEEDDPRVVFLKPVMNPIEWMKICDYIALLSDTEACPYNVLEALKIGKPMLITRLSILDEMGVNETNSKIYEFDMSNLDIDDLWNIPIVKNWKEPNSKGWEKYMKKKVFRERQEKPIEKVEVKEEPKVEEKKEVKKTTKKKKDE